MYCVEDFLAEIHITEEQREKCIRLPYLMPVGRIVHSGCGADVSISHDGKEFLSVGAHGGNRNACYLKVKSTGECRVKFFVGVGYWAKPDNHYSEAFMKNRSNGWAGGDGINSFNLSNGIDAYQAACRETLFIFGDTLVSQVTENNERIEPVFMPNNTYAYMKGNLEQMEFVIPLDEEGKPAAALKPKTEDGSQDGWFWLQDGVVIENKLYLTPLLMYSDESKKEGFQFRVADVCMLEIPIIEGKADFQRSEQLQTMLYKRVGNKEYIGGIAYMPYCAEMGYTDGDGFIYAYGYISSEQATMPGMIVGRVTPEQFKNPYAWNFYNGNEFVQGIENGKLVLEHISCEMSVMPIAEGYNRGKFLAVFQYDGQSPYVGYAIGETPWGPFSEPGMVYECDERQRVNETVYTYNAKAHPHLSEPDAILVSYNVNSPSMEENNRTADIYHPRFIRLHDTTIQEVKEDGTR